MVKKVYKPTVFSKSSYWFVIIAAVALVTTIFYLQAFPFLVIVILGFFVILVIGENLWASAFVSMSIALNPNLMFQASVTYYENCAIFWVFLSLLFYVRLWIGRGRVHRSLFLFAACSALAIATHDRMAGYYFLSIPALIFKMYSDKHSEKGGVKNATYSTLFLFVIGTTVFFLANNIIGAGIKPIQDYLVYKYSGGAVLPGRMKSIWSFLRNQLGCHWQTVRLVFWNLGGITLIISFLGFWHLWKKKLYAGLIMLLFPLGYQIICVGVPGWTVGRYILGQTLFVTLFAGLGVIWLLINMPRLGKIIIVAALIAQFATTIAVKAADTHFNPIRITEKMITKENGPNIVNAVGVRGFRKYESYDCFPETWNKRPDIRFTYISEGDKFSGDFDMIVSDSKISVNKSFKINREMHIKPPAWLTKLVKKWCYLYSAGPTEIYIQIKQD